MSTDLVTLRPMLAAAREHYTAILAIEQDVQRNFEALYREAWQFGKVLSAVKAEVGHGKWLFFLGANWPELGVRTAQRSMAFFDDNPNASVPTHFTVDSIRKLLGGYVPAKERPELDGDQPVPPARHHLTAVNQIATFTHRLEVGLIRERPPVDVLRRDFEQPLRKLIDVLGKDWISGLLSS